MATPLKIDPIKLNELLNEGKKTKEIAKFFNCSPGAVSQAKRRLAVAVDLPISGLNLTEATGLSGGKRERTGSSGS